MIEIREYLDTQGRSRFGRWFNRLNPHVAAKVTDALVRIEHGSLSNVKGVGASVFEYRIAFGPGYRVFFRKDGNILIILLGGGIKMRQQKDIEAARRLWQDYRRRKRRET